MTSHLLLAHGFNVVVKTHLSIKAYVYYFSRRQSIPGSTSTNLDSMTIAEMFFCLLNVPELCTNACQGSHTSFKTNVPVKSHIFLPQMAEVYEITM
jgi:hypothetical protein